ncbi:MAG: cheW 2 [Massilibacillus sp.]|jgi:purine-binding chemotaxis protein CheW|nr:cheW 2 [Massilibacillus sp.]
MDNGEDLQIVAFRLSSEEYALPITKVKDINRFMPLTKMPKSPAFMKGVINLRGEIIPVVDLRERFGLPVSEATDDSRIMVVDFNNRLLGIIVDCVTEVLSIPTTEIDIPPAAAKLNIKQVPGVGKVNNRLLILLNIDEVFSEEEVKSLKDIKRDE